MYTKRTLLPVPLLKIKEGCSEFEDTTPQQRLEYKSKGHFTGVEEVGSSDSGIASNGFDFEETPDVNATKQGVPYKYYNKQAIEDLNTACFDGRLDVYDFSTNNSACYSCTQNSCLNAKDLEFLNKAYEFYVNDAISLS